METFNTIRRLAVDKLNADGEALLRARTLNEAGIDSLGAIDLVYAIEGHYRISIAADDLARVQSLHDLAVIADRLVTRKACCHEA